jgi:hypothetical protein
MNSPPHSTEATAGSGEPTSPLGALPNVMTDNLMRYLQDLPDADKPVSPIQPKFHTGKIPNSKVGDGKPRLMLMGQRG